MVMAAPLKPWEKAGVNNQNAGNSFSNQMSSLPDTMLPTSMGDRTPLAAAPAPPIPSRNSQASGLGSYGSPYGGSSYGSMYGSSMYGSGLYGGGSMYGGGMYGGGMYGGYGGGMYGTPGYNRYGQNQYSPNSFIQQAEESSRQAFQSVESVVQAFGSISMMLDSTFYALYNSFRAVLGVADQFSRVKAHFGQILSALAIFRTLRWLWRKLLVFLRLRKGGLPEDVWSQAAEEGVKSILSEHDLLSAKGKPTSSWPIFIFFAVIFGGPWLIWKLLSRLQGDLNSIEWMSGKDEHYLAAAEYDFLSQNDDELSFKRGQKIVIAPKELQPRMRGWLLASVDGVKTGVIPANYVKILGKRPGTNSGKKPPSSAASRTLPPSSNPPNFANMNEQFHASQSMPDFTSFESFSNGSTQQNEQRQNIGLDAHVNSVNENKTLVTAQNDKT